MKQNYLAVLAFASGALLSCQAFAERLVNEEKASEIAGDMYQAYRSGGISNMLSMENSCWDELIKQRKKNEKGSASCSIAGLAGSLIEGSFARQQRRGPAPAYSGESVRGRILKNMGKAGFSETEAQQTLETSVGPNHGAIISGLANAGMR